MPTEREVLEREALAFGLPRRSRMETYLAILMVVKSGTEGSTTILHRANLGEAAMQEYIQPLVAKGLLLTSESKEGKRTYSVSKTGFAFLRLFDPSQR
jgi:predicted transcriptional regulator